MEQPQPRVILLVDDVEQVVSIAGEYLERRLEHVRVVTMVRPLEALEWLRHAPRVDLILTDNHMEEMGGIELLGHARELHPRAVRALMTAYLDIDATPEDLSAMGVHALIRKPWEWPQLARFLEELLGLRAEDRAQLEAHRPRAFPASAFQEFAARGHAPPAPPPAPEEPAARAPAAAEEAPEGSPQHPVRARVDPVTGGTRVACPVCEAQFHVHLPEAAALPFYATPPPPPAAAPAPAPAPAHGPLPAHGHAASLSEEQEARRILAYLRARPGVARHIRAMQPSPSTGKPPQNRDPKGR